MSGTPPDYYKLLGLPPSATAEEIKKQYRELARRYHPDVNPNPDAAQKIKSINEAYHTLGDADRRAAYDADRHLRQQIAAVNFRTPPANPSSAPNTQHPTPNTQQANP